MEIFLFIWTVLIDFVRNSLDGIYWLMLDNTLFIVVSVFVFLKLEKHFTIRKAGFVWLFLWAALSALGVFLWKKEILAVVKLQLISGIIAALFFGFAVLSLWHHRKKLRKPGKLGLACMGCALFIGIWALISKNHDSFPLLYAISFSMLNLLPYTDKEREKLSVKMAWGIFIGGVCVQIYAWGFRPYDTVRYKGAFPNMNINSLFYLCVLVSVLYLSYWYREKTYGVSKFKYGITVLLTYFFAGAIGAEVFFTGCRTDIIAEALIFIFFETLTCARLKHGALKALGRLALSMICVLCFIPAMYMANRWLPTILHHPVWYSQEGYSEKWVHSFDPADSEKYVKWEEFRDEMLYRMNPFGASKSEALADSEEYIKADLAPEKSNYRTFVAREVIWGYYIERLNLFGHSNDELYFKYMVGDAKHTAFHAQNVFLQYAFLYGIPAMVALLIELVLLSIVAFKAYFTNLSKGSVLCILSGVLFISHGMLEAVWYTGQLVLFMIYMSTVFIPRKED